MAEISRTEIWDSPIERVFDVLSNYETYPDFVDGVSDISILESSEEGARVRFSLNLIKKFSYTLNLVHQRPQCISWTFESGDIFKVNNGSWDLKDLGDGKTEVTYTLEVEVKGFVPKAIVTKLTSKNFPNMMQSYHNRVRGH